MARKETLEAIRYTVACVCEWVSGDCESDKCPFSAYCDYGNGETDNWSKALDEVAMLIAQEMKGRK